MQHCCCSDNASSASGISWAVCKSASRSRQITMPAPHHSVFYRPDALFAAQPTASKQIGNRNTIILKLPSKMPTYAEKNMRYIRTIGLLKYANKCGNKRNMWQSHICTKLTCLGSGISSCRQSACQRETIPPTPAEVTVMGF